MRIGRAEAEDLLAKFESERTLLDCVLSFPGFRARLRGRLRRFADGEIRICSDDTVSELALYIRLAMEFDYGEPRRIPAGGKYAGVLIVFFRLGEEGEEADYISLAEVKAAEKK